MVSKSAQMRQTLFLFPDGEFMRPRYSRQRFLIRPTAVYEAAARVADLRQPARYGTKTVDVKQLGAEV